MIRKLRHCNDCYSKGGGGGLSYNSTEKRFGVFCLTSMKPDYQLKLIFFHTLFVVFSFTELKYVQKLDETFFQHLLCNLNIKLNGAFCSLKSLNFRRFYW